MDSDTLGFGRRFFNDVGRDSGPTRRTSVRGWCAGCSLGEGRKVDGDLQSARFSTVEWPNNEEPVSYINQTRMNIFLLVVCQTNVSGFTIGTVFITEQI